MTITTADGELLHYSAVASEPLESKSQAPAAEVAASRAAALTALGLDMRGDPMIINFEWQDRNGNWHHYQSKQEEKDAYRRIQRRAEANGKNGDTS